MGDEFWKFWQGSKGSRVYDGKELKKHAKKLLGMGTCWGTMHYLDIELLVEGSSGEKVAA